MSISMHSASVPVFVKLFQNMLTWLDKAEAHAQAKKFEPAVFLTARLAPDMLPFARQIQIASDSCKFGVARLAGIEPPKYEDNEQNFADLRERIRKTIAFMEGIPAAQIDGSEERDIVVPRRDGSITLKGEFYLKHFVMPNFYFHVTTTYALLRHWGVDLGKRDFLGPLQ